jgi:hypothetical protein
MCMNEQGADFDSGTMVQKGGDDGEFNSGTMVVSKSESKAPDFMKGHEKKNGVTPSGGAYKTGKGLEVAKNASAKDLSASLADLDKAAEEVLYIHAHSHCMSKLTRVWMVCNRKCNKSKSSMLSDGIH